MFWRKDSLMSRSNLRDTAFSLHQVFQAGHKSVLPLDHDGHPGWEPWLRAADLVLGLTRQQLDAKTADQLSADLLPALAGGTPTAEYAARTDEGRRLVAAHILAHKDRFGLT